MMPHEERKKLVRVLAHLTAASVCLEMGEIAERVVHEACGSDEPLDLAQLSKKIIDTWKASLKTS